MAVPCSLLISHIQTNITSLTARLPLSCSPHSSLLLPKLFIAHALALSHSISPCHLPSLDHSWVRVLLYRQCSEHMQWIFGNHVLLPCAYIVFNRTDERIGIYRHATEHMARICCWKHLHWMIAHTRPHNNIISQYNYNIKIIYIL